MESITEQKMMSVPEEFVPQNFEMNPETEDLIRGNLVQENMIVLVEGLYRTDPSGHEVGVDHECDAYNCPRLLKESRWCRVTQIERRGELLSFIGAYSDGRKASRTYNLSYCWFVKLDSFESGEAV